MQIRTPTGDEVKRCYELELACSASSPSASMEGFFLPGVQFSVYEDLHAAGGLRAIFTDEGGLAAFAMIVPPGHATVKRLLADKTSIVLFEPETIRDIDRCVWIAKVATRHRDRRLGYGSRLYQEVFERFRTFDIFTATALSPLRNHASEAFHDRMGMRKVGAYLSGTRGDFANVVNIVWHRR